MVSMLCDKTSWIECFRAKSLASKFALFVKDSPDQMPSQHQSPLFKVKLRDVRWFCPKRFQRVTPVAESVPRGYSLGTKWQGRS